MPPQNVLVLGAASWNRMIHVDHLPQGREATIFAAKQTEAAGSTGVGKAMVASTLGHNATLHCTLGQDRLADQIHQTCTDRGIDMIVDVQDDPTPQHLNIMDKAGGRFSIFLANGPETPNIDPAPLVKAIATADVIFLSLAASSKVILPLLKAATAPIHLDIHDYDGYNPWYASFIAIADVIQVSAVALPAPKDTIATLLSGRASQVVLTKGADGAEVFMPDTHIKVAAAPANCVDSNGAGDAFSVAFWHAQQDGASLKDAAIFASKAAAYAVESYDLYPAHATADAITKAAT